MLPVANNMISAFRVSDPGVTNVNSGRVILQEAHPQFKHNAITIIGPDGLYHGGNKNDHGAGHVVKEGTLTKIWTGFKRKDLCTRKLAHQVL